MEGLEKVTGPFKNGNLLVSMLDFQGVNLPSPKLRKKNCALRFYGWSWKMKEESWKALERSILWGMGNDKPPTLPETNMAPENGWLEY